MLRIIATIAAALAIAIVLGATVFDRTSPANDLKNYGQFAGLDWEEDWYGDYESASTMFGSTGDAPAFGFDVSSQIALEDGDELDEDFFDDDRPPRAGPRMPMLTTGSAPAGKASVDGQVAAEGALFFLDGRVLSPLGVSPSTGSDVKDIRGGDIRNGSLSAAANIDAPGASAHVKVEGDQAMLVALVTPRGDGSAEAAIPSVSGVREVLV